MDESKKRVYIAACGVGGGIYVYDWKNGGKMTLIAVEDVDNVMFLEIEGNQLYASVGMDATKAESGYVLRYDIDGDGLLTNKTVLGSTNGTAPCHICVDNGEAYVVNYGSGSVTAIAENKTVTHEGVGVSLPRQASAHTHMAMISPGKRRVFVTDLGLDTVFVYDRQLNPVSKARVPKGYGARHLVVGNDGHYIYCVNELVSSVSVLYYKSGVMEYIDTVSCPIEYDGVNTAAAIRLTPDGKTLFISNRGENTIAAFSVNGSKLKFLQKTDCKGDFPRDFDLTPDGRYALCCNQKSNDLTMFRVNGADLEYMTTIDGVLSPLCVKFLEMD